MVAPAKAVRLIPERVPGRSACGIGIPPSTVAAAIMMFEIHAIMAHVVAMHAWRVIS
jgi:hypothetical protein